MPAQCLGAFQTQLSLGSLEIRFRNLLPDFSAGSISGKRSDLAGNGFVRQDGGIPRILALPEQLVISFQYRFAHGLRKKQKAPPLSGALCG